MPLLSNATVTTLTQGVCAGQSVVRGGVEPPTFRFQEACLVQVSPPKGRLTRPYDVRPVLGVQHQQHMSTAVVSAALASSTVIAPGWGTSELRHASITGLKLERGGFTGIHGRSRRSSGSTRVLR